MGILRSQMQTLVLNCIRAQLVPCPSVSYVMACTMLVVLHQIMTMLYYTICTVRYHTTPYHLTTCPPVFLALYDTIPHRTF